MSPVRVVIADDSPTLRRTLAALLADEPRIALIGEARDGEEALRAAREWKPDVITMDAQMPGLDGLAATERIMDEAPTRVLLVCAVAEERQLDLSFRAIAAGALELIAKPAPIAGESDLEISARLRKFGEQLRGAILLMAEVPVVRRRTFSASNPGVQLSAPRHRVDAIGIAASTGGPPALATLLGRLPRSFGGSILIAQHIAQGFGEGLLRWLANGCSVPVRRARDREKLTPGVVYLAPDGCDLGLEPGCILRTPRSSGFHCPSADALFDSLAHSLGPRALGLVLTGMGDDGAQGLLALRRAGGVTAAQDAASSAVFGMPKAALDAGAAQESMSLERMARLIVELS